jgi:hypothetical protein
LRPVSCAASSRCAAFRRTPGSAATQPGVIWGVHRSVERCGNLAEGRRPEHFRPPRSFGTNLSPVKIPVKGLGCPGKNRDLGRRARRSSASRSPGRPNVSRAGTFLLEGAGRGADQGGTSRTPTARARHCTTLVPVVAPRGERQRASFAKTLKVRGRSADKPRYEPPPPGRLCLVQVRATEVVGAGFEPAKAEPMGLQPIPFDRSGTPPGTSELSV